MIQRSRYDSSFFSNVPVNVISSNGIVPKIWDEKENPTVLSIEITYCGASLSDSVSVGLFFLNAYISGDVGQLNIPEAMMYLISAMKIPGSEDSMFKTFFAGGKLIIRSQNLGEFKPLKSASLDGRGYFVSNEHNVISSVDASDIQNFYNKMKTLGLSKDVHDQENFVNILGWISLSLIRLVAKTSFSVSNYLKNRSSSSFCNLFGVSQSPNIIPPHWHFRKNCEDVIQKRVQSVKRLLNHILRIYYLAATSCPSKKIQAILRAGCLLHLEFNGMMIVKTLIHLSAASGTGIKTILEKSAYDVKYYSSIKNVAEVLKRYYSKPEVTLFPWSRIIDDSYHSELSAKENKDYLILLFNTLYELDKAQYERVWDQQPFEFKPEISSAVDSWTRQFVDSVRQ